MAKRVKTYKEILFQIRSFIADLNVLINFKFSK